MMNTMGTFKKTVPKGIIPLRCCPGADRTTHTALSFGFEGHKEEPGALGSTQKAAGPPESKAYYSWGE